MTEAFGDGDTIVHADATERNERHNIRGADARMRARVLIEVDQFGGGLDGAEGGFFHTRGRTGKGEHRAVVVEVGGAVEEFDLADRLDGGNDLVNDFRSPRFGKVGDAFDECGS